jgi:phenylacetate-CoA ligase
MDETKPQSIGELIRRTLAIGEKSSIEQLAGYQRSQLEQLLRFAHARAPFYKERLAPLFGKHGNIDWSQWPTIPILTRVDVKANGSEMMPTGTPDGHGFARSVASSGTTGMPVTVHSTDLMSVAGALAFERACRWYGYQIGDRICVALNTPQIESLNRETWAVGDEVTGGLTGNQTSIRLGVSRSWPPELILSHMMQHGSVCFSGNSTTVEDLAETQLQQDLAIQIKFMVGKSMALTERARTLVRQAFKSNAFSVYSSMEAHKIAHECPVSGGFHVNSELVVVEIVDDEGRACAVGETGRVIVTPLLGTAQPLIRYEQGDLATWGKPCSCGRPHPVIAKIEGRIRNRFQFAGGHKFTPAIGFEPYRDLLKADQWQVAQTGPLDIEVRFISSAPDEAIDFAGLTRVFAKSFHEHLSVSYRRMDVLPRTAAGKFIDYVNEYDAHSDVRSS